MLLNAMKNESFKRCGKSCVYIFEAENHAKPILLDASRAISHRLIVCPHARNKTSDGVYREKMVSLVKLAVATIALNLIAKLFFAKK